MQIQNGKGYIPVLDGVRGCAILLVMLYHFSIPFQNMSHLTFFDELVSSIFQVGWIGVDLFFVLSGYLITGILSDSVGKPKYLSNFFIRRILRIFPLFYAVLFVLIVFIPIAIPSLSESTKQMQENQVWFWSYLVNWYIASVGGFSSMQGGYLWSLAVEEQFYLVWPFIVLVLRQKLFEFCLVLGCLGIIVRLFLLYIGVEASVVYVMTITHLDSLLIGSGMAVLIRRYPVSFLNYQRYVILFSILAGLTIFYIFIDQGKFVFYQKVVGGVGLLMVAIVSGGLVYCALNAREGGFLFKLLSNVVVMRFGKLCYGLYLFHHPIGVLVNEKILSQDGFIFMGSYLPAVIVSMSISLFISYVLAEASFRLFETPILNLKKHFV